MTRQPLSGKAIATEREYPYIVELLVADDKLDLDLSRRIIAFHGSRNIQVRHGRRIVRQDEIYFRWCFSDSDTASAFGEQFGGELTRGGQPERRRR
jgi:hypothetical protein